MFRRPGQIKVVEVAVVVAVVTEEALGPDVLEAAVAEVRCNILAADV